MYQPRTRIIPCADAKDCPETGNPCPYAKDYGGKLCRNTMCSVHSSLGANFTESYRNKHWRLCRYEIDPRKCKCYVSSENARDLAVANNCGSYAATLSVTPTCLGDEKPCNARWEE